MFGFVKSQKENIEIGGAIREDRRKKERTLNWVFGVFALIVVNVALYLISNV